MENSKKYSKISKRIIVYIFLPLLLSLFIVNQMRFNLIYLIVGLQIIIFISVLGQINFKINEKQLILFTLFFLLFFISVFSSFFTDYTLKSIRLSFLIYVTSLLLILIIVNDNNPYDTFKKNARLQMNIGVILSIIGIILFVFGKRSIVNGRSVQLLYFGRLRIYQIIGGWPPFYRIASLTTNVNTLGLILMISQIMTIYLYKINEIKKNRFLMSYILQVLALLLTQSRASIISAIIMVFMFNILKSKNIYERIKYYLISFFSLLAATFILRKINIKAILRLNRGFSGRDSVWGIILEEIKTNLFTGTGFRVSLDTILLDVGIKAHNLFLEILLEIGLIGFIVFVLIWIIGIFFSIKSVNSNKENEEKRITFLVIASILVSLIFHQSFENQILMYHYMTFYWIYIIFFTTL